MSALKEIPAARLPVWKALAEFFLDTELQEADYRRIAASLAGSPYSVSELEQILRYEVYPVCRQNLLCIAGEWGGFDEQWLIERITPFYGKWPRRRIPRLHAWMFKRHWKKIQPMVNEIRASK